MANYEDIISRLGTRFNNAVNARDIPDELTRDIGGQFRNNQPYITGYFQVMFGLPQRLFQDNADAASKWLHTTCENFTPHSQTLTKVDLIGQGQLGSSFVSNVMTTREFTCAFREYQNMPVLNVIRQWASIFDPATGVSPLSGNEFIPSNYKGWAAVIQTKPVKSQNASIEVSDIEECYIYQGVFPVMIPVDTASAADVNGNDMVQLSVNFSFDGAPLTSSDPGIADKCVSLLSNMSALSGGQIGSSYEKYVKGSENIRQWTSTPADINESSKPSI